MLSGPDLASDVRSVPFARRLSDFGDRIAIVEPDGELSYRELADRVAAFAARLGTARRLVLLAGGNRLDAVVAYLAALAAGHPLLLVPGDSGAALDSLVAAYDPDVVIGRDGGLLERRAGSAHTPHPDLALLLSTSGSTGAPKLVRLSHANLQANASAIAEYLDIRPADRAATTLPMHYCYGLSVLNSHLVRGAGLILTDRSVAEPDFWDLFRAARGTAFAGVPYTFDLLDRAGFGTMRLPHLRYVTQAGGRLAPERVAHYAALGRRHGWDLFVMYGQTEATARMAYLPPELAREHPGAIGVPIPGGAFRLAPLPEWPSPEPDIGELVYSGPNVMLGYAEGPADLALGRTVSELRTGDVARRLPDGLYEIVGRRGGFVKVLGLRVDPPALDAALGREGVTAVCAAAEDQLVIAVRAPADPDRVRRLGSDRTGLPPHAVRVHVLDDLPRLPSGKPDRVAVGALPPPAAAPAAASTDLRQLYAQVLHRADVTEDSTFVGLGGDSLSYVEMSVKLERALGHLPAGWHALPIRSLRRQPGRWRRSLDTSVALRALAIVLIVGTHATLFNLSGGAHLLLGVAGFNFARFHLTDATRRDRPRPAPVSGAAPPGAATPTGWARLRRAFVSRSAPPSVATPAGASRWDRLRRVWGGIARIAVPSLVWIAFAYLVLGAYGPANLVFLNGVLGPRTGGDGWHLWFVEALLQILVVATVLLAVFDRWERRFPFAFPVALLTLCLVTRYDLLDLRAHYHLPSAVWVCWLFALGWAAAKATTRWHRLAVTAAAFGTVPGFFGDPAREAVVVAGLVALIWLPSLPGTAVVNRVAGVLAGASLYIYLVHWQVYPRLDHHNALVAVLASLAAGIAFAALARVTRATSAKVKTSITAP